MIPKIILQTYSDSWEDMPEHIRLDCISWKEMHPEWDYRFFNDKDRIAFIKEHFPNYYPIYKKISIPYIRADFWRYLALYQFGGVYVDADTYPIAKLDDWIDIDSKYELITFYSDDEIYGKGIENWFLAMSPGNRYIRKIIDNMISLIINEPGFGRHEVNINHTGPKMLAKTIFEMMDPETAKLDLIHSGLMFVHHKNGSSLWADGQEHKKTMHDYWFYNSKVDIKMNTKGYGSEIAVKWQ